MGISPSRKGRTCFSRSCLLWYCYQVIEIPLFVEDSNFDHEETPYSRAKDAHELIITVAYIVAYTAVKANGEQERNHSDPLLGID